MIPRLCIVFCLVSALGLAGCESSEERAEGHYQSSLALVEEGDIDRAIVELRNTLQLDEDHREGRRLFADLMLRQDREADAFREYVRLAEQYPEDLAALTAASRIAYERQDWQTLDRFVPAAIALEPDNLELRGLSATLDYRNARITGDDEASEASRKRAEAVLKEDAENVPARDVLIDALIQDEDLDAALEELEAVLALAPDSLRHHEMKLRLLIQQARTAEIGATLEELNRRFPENERIRNLLIEWYVSQDRLAEAETLLRRIAEEAEGDAAQSAWLTVIELVRRSRGLEAALEEVDARIEAADTPIFYERVRAEILAQDGQNTQAISDLRAALETAEPSSSRRDAQVFLARLLRQSGDEVGARAEIEDVLSAQPTHVDALKMRGAWLIEDDRVSDAITSLQTAIEGAPDDTGALLLMAQAQLLDGNRRIAGQRLATAVDISGQAPTESLAYADFLLQEGDTDQAEATLTTALQRSPAELSIIARLGNLYLAQTEWQKMSTLLRRLAAVEGSAARGLENNLRASLLLRQQKTEEMRGFLDALNAEGQSTEIETAALMTRSYLSSGDVEGARAHVDRLLAEAPENPDLRYLDASLDAVAGDLDSAEAGFRALLEETPGNVTAARALFTLLFGTGRTEEADVVLTEAYEATPENLDLGLLRASRLEQQGKIDAAIEIYETLYDRHRGNVAVTNNLASLLSSYRDDPESLERAYALARRLRTADVPALLDTYGWISYRRGNLIEAVEYLERAAEGMPESPEVVAHLGLAYAAQGQTEKARETLTRALTLGDPAAIPILAEAEAALADFPDGVGADTPPE